MLSLKLVTLPKGVYLSACDMERIKQCDQQSVNVYFGKAGTIIIADTSGFHKGGRAIGGSRHILVAFFTSDAAVDRHYYSLPSNYNTELLSRQARYALGLDSR